MVKLLQDCNVWVDNGSECGDACRCWYPWWESKKFPAGEEFEEGDPRFNFSSLEEGVDFVRVEG